VCTVNTIEHVLTRMRRAGSGGCSGGGEGIVLRQVLVSSGGGRWDDASFLGQEW
jgi:hypothetical protein